MDAQVLGISIDSSPSHKAFAERLGVKFPLLSDMHRRVARLYGVLVEEDGTAARAAFVIDKKGIVRHVVINDPAIKRNEKEFVRILRHIQESDK